MEIKCPLCLKPHFDDVDALRSTLVSVATSNLTCPVCSDTLLGLDKLTIHLFSHINNAQVTKNVDQEIAREEIDKTISECSKESEENRKETTNDAQSSKTEEDIIRCDICSFSFTDRNILEMHQKLLHQTSPDKKTGTYSYHCHLCSKKFRMRGSLMVHLRVAHYGFVSHSSDSQSDGARKVAATWNLVGRVKEENNEANAEMKVQKNGQGKALDNKQWECDVCSKMFTTKYFLKKHKRLHTGEMPYCCTLCNKSFTFQQSYHKHMLYHSSEKPYVCNECGRAFKELSTLQNHARIHSGERPFGCETCGKRFRQRVSYLVHRRIHTGVMPYKCTACEKTFRYKVSQRSHKCPMNPPGNVIRILDADKCNAQDPTATSPTNTLSTNQNNAKCIMSVDLNTGKINFVPENQGGDPHSNVLYTLTSNGGFQDGAQIQKKSITINNNEQIEISYNKADLQSAISKQNTGSAREMQRCVERVRRQTRGNGLQKPAYADSDGDLLSMVLSPILPEVESLCLNNSPNDHSPLSSNQDDSIDVMGEKCLQEFLYGPN